MNETFQVSNSKEVWVRAVKEGLQKQLDVLPTTRTIAYRLGSALSLVIDLHKETLRLKTALNKLLVVFADNPVNEGYVLSEEELEAVVAAKQLLVVAEGDETSPPAVEDL